MRKRTPPLAGEQGQSLAVWLSTRGSLLEALRREPGLGGIVSKRTHKPHFQAGRPVFTTLALFWLFFPSFLPVRCQAGHLSSVNLDQLFRLGVEAQQRGDYRRAATIYKQILDYEPHSPEARSNLGLMYHHLGEYKEAVSTFEVALSDNPRLYVPNLFLGLDLLTLHKPQKALPHLEVACELNQHDPQPQVGLGAALLALGSRDKARDAYERAVEIDLRNPDAWYGLGVAYLDLQKVAVDRLAETGKESPYARDLVAHSLLVQGTPDAAANVYRGVLASKASLPCLNADLGFAYLEMENLQSAEEAFQNGIRDHPGCLLARLGLAALYVKQRESEKALRLLFDIWSFDLNFLQENLPTLFVGLNDGEIALLKDSSAVDVGAQQYAAFRQFVLSAIQAVQDDAYEGRGALALVSPEVGDKPTSPAQVPAVQTPESLLSQGRYTECDRSLRLRRSPLASSDLETLCECAYYSGDLRTSFLASGELARRSTDTVAGLYWRARSSEKLGGAALRQAGLVAPNSSRVHFLLGEFYRQSYQEDQAEVEYLKVIETQPNNVAAHLGLADAYSMTSDFDKATAELKHVLSLDPGQPDSNYLMGNILVFQHQYAEATPYLETALKGNASRAPAVHALMSRVYSSQGRTLDAIAELRQALGADQDGSLHYQLFTLYRKTGDAKAAAAALEQSRSISQQKRGHPAPDTIVDPLLLSSTSTSP